MYNRYIPEDASYTWTEAAGQRRGPCGGGGRPAGGGFRFPVFLAGGESLGTLFSGGTGGSGGLASLFRTLHLDGLDSGDVLLLLIVLYLLVEGDDLDLVIALGLVLLMGLGDRNGRPEP